MQENERLICASNLVNDIKNKVSSMATAGCDSKWVYRKVMECIQAASPVEAKPIVYTQWDDYSTSMMECRVCKKHVPRHQYKFRPNCGAAVSTAGKE